MGKDGVQWMGNKKCNIRNHYHFETFKKKILRMHKKLLTQGVNPYKHLQTDNYVEYLQPLNNITNQVNEVVAAGLIYV